MKSTRSIPKATIRRIHFGGKWSGWLESTPDSWSVSLIFLLLTTS